MSGQEEKKWIRGVNLGGWLLMERYIVPYQFAITTCHLEGDLCWYPGALSAPDESDPDYKICDFDKCKPVRFDSVFGWPDYPVDEWHLSSAFPFKTDAEKWLNYHFENFITRDDLVQMKEAGLTHLRVPLPHWILGSVALDEPWIPGDRWKYFLRLCQWAREIGLELWPSLHTAPGSQNGFDNSGIQSTEYTCGGWEGLKSNVNRTLDVIDAITAQMAHDNVLDVVTGWGILNEPFWDCDVNNYKQFMEDGLVIARANLGQETSIFVSDKFNAPTFNNGSWWLDESKYSNTYLDTHFYQVFDTNSRMDAPQKHIQDLCQPSKPEFDMTSCCYEDAPKNTIRSKGVQRISTEWSAAFDSMPGELLQDVMRSIYENNTAPDFDRVMSPARMQFLKQYVEAQIVQFEVADVGVSHGWFYWTIKLEGGAFAEWDFSRGVREGWIPTIAQPHQASQELYGTCEQIQNRTTTDMSIVHAYPWGDEPYWTEGTWRDWVDYGRGSTSAIAPPKRHDLIISVVVAAVVLMIYFVVRCRGPSQRKWNYTSVSDEVTEK